ncbi:MAG: ATP-binding protein [Dehalococcoidales bacterium]
MKGIDMTKEQLMDELVKTGQRITDLEASETERKKVEEELRKHREHLEELVKERTAELEKRNEQLQKEITERKLAEEGIGKFKVTADNAAYGVSISDLDGKLVYVNESYAKMHGYTVAETVGRHFSVFYTKDQAKFMAQRREKVVQMGSYVGDEVWHKRKDGTIFPTLTTSTVIKDSEGRPSYISATHFNLTERKRAEEELRKHREHLEELVKERTRELVDAQEKLLRSERLTVLGQLAGGVGHELRNPLGALKNAAYFLNMVLEKPEPEVKETLEILEKEVATSERIVGSLLDFARPKPPTRRKMNINEVVQETLSLTALPENVRMVRQLDESLPEILADPDQLGIVFSNIIRNGIQAMPDGGRLLVKSKAINSERVVISIADTGVGIPKEKLPQIFEPLFTTKAKGIGLGLAVTKSLVEGHGGTIKVRSKVGKGSTFTVGLPIGEEKEK